MSLRTLDDLDVCGRRVLIRADLNVPIQNGKVLDDTRLRACIDTMRQVLARGGRPIVMSHLGRPRGRVEPEFSLAPLAALISDYLDGERVVFAPDCVGAAAQSAIEGARGQVVLLENLRFHSGEKDNDPDFAQALAALADIYMNDAFSAAHRSHASIVGVAEHLPAAAGCLLEREVENLDRLLAAPQRPALAIVGGAKVADKLPVIEALCAQFEAIALAGVVANTFLAGQGIAVGRSLYDDSLTSCVPNILARARHNKCELILPVDAVVSDRIEPGRPSRNVAIDSVPADMLIADLGPNSVAALLDRIEQAGSLVWVGPVGAADEGFDGATQALADAVARCTDARGLHSVAGGGETVASLRAAGVTDRFSYISLAGGAFLEWLRLGDDLPGLIPLQRD